MLLLLSVMLLISSWIALFKVFLQKSPTKHLTLRYKMFFSSMLLSSVVVPSSVYHCCTTPTDLSMPIKAYSHLHGFYIYNSGVGTGASGAALAAPLFEERP